MIPHVQKTDAEDFNFSRRVALFFFSLAKKLYVSLVN